MCFLFFINNLMTLFFQIILYAFVFDAVTHSNVTVSLVTWIGLIYTISYI